MHFQVERWANCSAEILSIVGEHHREIALDQERIPLEPDCAYYKMLDDHGMLSIITARDNGELVGYYANVVRTHPHYRATLFAMVDLYFILPEYRRGAVGIEMFRFMEKTMRGLGVKSMISTTKLHYDLTPLFERLRWEPVGKLFQKWIGD